MSRLRREASALLVLALSGLSCSLGPSLEEKREAGALSRAIDVLRETPNSGKAAPLAALTQISAEQPALRELRQHCVAAYELHVRGVEHQLQAKAALLSGTDKPSVDGLVASAEDELARARPLVEKCADEQGELKRRYKLQ